MLDISPGGFTIFPKLNLFFKPQSGQLLYWNLKRTDGSVDQRSVECIEIFQINK